MIWYEAPWGPGTLMLRSFLEDIQYEDEAALLIKFKGLLSSHHITSEWCLRHGIEVITEMDDIAPMEAFLVGYRTWERILGEQGKCKQHVLRVLAKAGLDLEDKIVDFIVQLGDRIPVSENEDLVYLFPRDFVNKVLLFGTLPD